MGRASCYQSEVRFVCALAKAGKGLEGSECGLGTHCFSSVAAGLRCGAMNLGLHGSTFASFRGRDSSGFWVSLLSQQEDVL